MANPQTENGYTKIANEIQEAFCGIRISGEARQILDVIIRKTYGYNKKEDKISISQFCELTKMRDVDICRGIKKLINMNLITKKLNIIANIYSINKDFDKWKPLAKKLTISKKANDVALAKKLTNVSKKANLALAKKLDTKDNTTKDKRQGDLLKINIIENMYNYENIDENGNPIKKKRIGAISKEENNFLISMGFLWKDMVASHLKIPKEDIILLNIYYPLRSVYDREKWKKEDFKELFEYFLKDKIPDESKISFDLCLSQKYIAKFKLNKKLKSRPKTLSQMSDEIKL